MIAPKCSHLTGYLNTKVLLDPRVSTRNGLVVLERGLRRVIQKENVDYSRETQLIKATSIADGCLFFFFCVGVSFDVITRYIHHTHATHTNAQNKNDLNFEFHVAGGFFFPFDQAACGRACLGRSKSARREAEGAISL